MAEKAHHIFVTIIARKKVSRKKKTPTALSPSIHLCCVIVKHEGPRCGAMMELMGPLCGLEEINPACMHAWSCAPSTVHVSSERRCLCFPDAVVFMVRPA